MDEKTKITNRIQSRYPKKPKKRTKMSAWQTSNTKHTRGGISNHPLSTSHTHREPKQSLRTLL